MNSTELKKVIRDKYGSISRFARLIGRDTIDFHNSLKNESNIDDLHDLIKKTENKPIKGRELTPELSDLIRVKIYSNFKNATSFHERYPEFSLSWISNVINGKRGGEKHNKERVYLTPKIKKLCKILLIETK